MFQWGRLPPPHPPTSPCNVYENYIITIGPNPKNVAQSRKNVEQILLQYLYIALYYLILLIQPPFTHHSKMVA
jgi:hypothetical protein